MARGRGALRAAAAAAIAAGLLALLLFHRDGAVDRPVASVGGPGGRVGASDPLVGPAVPSSAAAPAAVPVETAAAAAAPAPGTGSIRVRVADSTDETPVAGASLTFWAGGAYRSGTTDAAGEALFPDLPGPRGNVLVCAAGRADARAEFLVERGQESLVVVDSRRLRILHGVVRSSADGRPIAGATVSVASHHPLSERAEGAPRRTGDDGRFTLPEPADRDAIPLRVVADGFVPETAEFRSARPGDEASPTFVDLDAAGRILGFVRNADGTPAVGARVDVGPVGTSSFGESIYFRSGRIVQRDAPQFETDSVGAFAVEGLERGGLFRVRASTRDRGGPKATAEVLVPWNGDGGAGDLVLGGTGGLRVTWSLKEAPDRPIIVTVRDGRSAPEILDSVSTREPCHEFESLPEGPVVVQVRSGRASFEASAVVVAGAMTEVEVEFSPTVSIEGLVRDAAGKPVSDCSVLFERADSQREPATRSSWLPSRTHAFTDFTGRGARSSSAGRFRLEGLEAGVRYRVFLMGTGDTVEVVAPATGVVFTVPSTGALTGRLMLPPGVIGPRRLHLVLEPEGQAARVLPLDWNEGRFRAEGLPAGRARFSAITLEARIPPREIEIPVDRALDLGELRMESGPLVRGVVRDPAGVPFSGRFVQLIGSRLAGISAQSESEGRFLLGCLPPGRYAVVVGQALAGEFTSRHEFDVGPDGADIDLVHPRGGSVYGTARTGAGVPLAGSSVRVAPVAGGDPLVLATVSHLGRWTVNLPEGDYRFEIVAADGGVRAEGRAKVPEGGEVVLDLVGER